MEEQDLNLVILAAGMGSRYGGLKQMDPVGPSGETILDYSLYDATQAGFTRVVFVIRKAFADAFRERLASRWPDLDAVCVFQEIDDLPRNVRPPADRTKPWGTGHAVLTAREAVTGPFAVINADDYYGPSAFSALADFLRKPQPLDSNMFHLSMVAYQLSQTLSAGGAVSRGLCSVENGQLKGIEELTKIARAADGQICTNSGRELADGDLVSMNCWGFPLGFFGQLDHQFRNFIQLNSEELTAEFYLPAAVDRILKCQRGDVAVLQSVDRWFGITYPEDRDAVVTAISVLVENGQYPNQLTACSN